MSKRQLFPVRMFFVSLFVLLFVCFIFPKAILIFLQLVFFPMDGLR